MPSGQTASVWVVFANCSGNAWDVATSAGVATGYKLGALAPQDNHHWGMNRVVLPSDVPAGHLVRVDFSVTAPSTPGVYGFQWAMVDEGVTWVDEPGPRHDVTVQGAPPPATATLADLWAGTAHFVPDQDPVPVAGASSGHREAFAVNRTDISPSTVYLYHRCFNQSAADASICLSISSDGGDSFSQFIGEIVAPDPGHIFSVAPAVFKKGSTWYMVYEESHVAEIWWAESPDGRSWTKRGRAITKTTNAWDSGANATPGAFVDDDGTIYVFYAGFPLGGVAMSIGYVSGMTMTSLAKSPHNPVYTPPATGWSKGQLSMPRVVKQGGVYYMIHEGATVDFTCEGYNTYGWGLARSSDLTSWDPLPQNPLGQAISGCGNDMPSLFIRYDGQVFAYHTSADHQRIVRERLVFK